ncbi:MAG TPA: GNAT family N-acetyltransferase [Xanthomonadaceae bacterium]|nr:GNAT family N-acetyltransferase [Xanthomonadaceae bacterium]
MAARNRLPPWHERLRLLNGRDMLIRPIRPEDVAPLRASLCLLKPDAIRLRCLQVSKDRGVDLAEWMTRPDLRHEFALVAAEPYPPGEAVVSAVARAAVVGRDRDQRDGSNARDADFDIMVSEHIAGLGLGRHLMQRLVRWGRAKRLRRLQGDLAEPNASMLQLARTLGFRHTQPPNQGLVRMTLDLQPD